MQLGVRCVWVDGVNTGFNSLGVSKSFYFWSDVSIELWSYFEWFFGVGCLLELVVNVFFLMNGCKNQLIH